MNASPFNKSFASGALGAVGSGIGINDFIQAIRSRKANRNRLQKQMVSTSANSFGYAKKRRVGQAKSYGLSPEAIAASQNTQAQPTNVVDNTVQPQTAYDPLTQYNPASLDPTGGAALMPPSNEAANLADPATRSFGVAGQVPMDMFGTPLERQRSVSKKYCKKNK